MTTPCQHPTEHSPSRLQFASPPIWQAERANSQKRNVRWYAKPEKYKFCNCWHWVRKGRHGGPSFIIPDPPRQKYPSRGGGAFRRGGGYEIPAAGGGFKTPPRHNSSLGLETERALHLYWKLFLDNERAVPSKNGLRIKSSKILLCNQCNALHDHYIDPLKILLCKGGLY